MVIKSKCIYEKKSIDDGFRICVMRFVKKYYKYDLWMRDLAPSVELLYDWKDMKIGWQGYKERYLGEMKGKTSVIREVLDLVKRKEVVTFLCVEKRDKFCHRRLLKELIEEVVKWKNL